MQNGSELSKIFSKHNIGTDFAVEILHRHFEIPAEKRLVKVGRVVTPWSADLVSLVEHRANLGKIAPEAIHFHNGTYYPYEFIHLTKAEAEAANGQDRFAKYSPFLEDFAKFIQEKGIAHVLGLRLLSEEEKKRAEDPTVHDYEVSDDGGHMTTLSTDTVLDARGYSAVAWSFMHEKVFVPRYCLRASECLCTEYIEKCSCLMNGVCTCTRGHFASRCC
ncbi:hypothetical protein F5Y19DRAFT_430024 [Xylariaceae sp. FL1651]|nr:hypothetical protein F5Y19DRAFT_430024 [Xylariaceae sp. FL1651]